LSLAMTNHGFNLANLITEGDAKDYKQVSWIVEEEGEVFTIAI